MSGDTMATIALAAVMIGGFGLLIAAITRPGLMAVGVLVGIRLSRAEHTKTADGVAVADGWDYNELVAAVVDAGMPRWLGRLLEAR